VSPSFGVAFTNVAPFRLLFDGRLITSALSATAISLDPGSGAVVARYTHSEPGDLDAAIAATHHAFDWSPWPRMTSSERAQRIEVLADSMQESSTLFCKFLDRWS